jgi:hypothetical protein
MQQDCGLLIAVCISVLLVGLFVWDALWVNNKTRITYVQYDASRVEGDYPVDAVYTWVNPADATWQKAYASATGKSDTSKRRFNNNSRLAADAELQTSMELLLKHCPWVRTVYVATMRPQVPPFLAKPEFRKELAAKIREEMNAVLQKYEDFGGIEEVFFTSFVVQ